MRQVRESEVLVPAQTLAFGDSALTPALAQFSAFSPEAYYGCPPSVVEFQNGWGGSSLQDRASAQASRHSGRFNAVFCDNHVECRKTNELFGLTDSVMRLWNRDNQPHRELWSAYGR